MATTSASSNRKRTLEDTELQVDLNAPEPPSKKAARALKKAKQKPLLPGNGPGVATDDDDLKRLNGLEGERSEHAVWIGNLAFTTTKKDLYKFLIKNHKITSEQVTRIHLPTSNFNKTQNKGFAYVDLDSSHTIQSALELSESLLAGRRLLIKEAKNFQGRPEQSKTKAQQEAQLKPPNRKIFVGNLHFETTRESLAQHFEVCGPIAHTHVATFEDSGKCKGYAWVEFESLSSAERAIEGFVEIDDPKKKTGKKKVWLHRIGERTLRMEYAEDAKTRYDKRYGKNSQEKEIPAEGMDDYKIANPTHARRSKQLAQERISRALQSDNETSSRTVKVEASRPQHFDDYRYDKKTAQKLTGAIVESKGAKVLFD